MKRDINLLQKRKAVQYSGKKLGIALLVIVLLGVLLYVGIKLPDTMLVSARIQLSNLDAQLESQPQIDQEQAEKTLKNAMLQQAVKQLEALNASKKSAAQYLEAVENSLPTSAHITAIMMSDNLMTINGIVPRDEVLATFALRLRESEMFESVYVTSSIYDTETKMTMFSLKAELPKYLRLSPDVIDGNDINAESPAQTTVTAAAENKEAAQ